MFALCLALLVSADDLEKLMGTDVYQAAGLHKLSEHERGVLSRWLLVYATKGQASPTAKMPGGKIADLVGGIIVASDGRLLGKITRDTFDLDSIANDTGQFGKKFGAESLLSRLSPYGDTMSMTSAFCPTATAPPRVYVGQKAVAWVTVNPQLKPRVDTHALLQYLGITQ